MQTPHGTLVNFSFQDLDYPARRPQIFHTEILVRGTVISYKMKTLSSEFCS